MIEKSKYFEQLPPPEDKSIRIHERVNDFIWVSDENIIYVVPKEKQVQLSPEHIAQQFADFQKEYGKKKHFILTVFNPSIQMNKNDRDFASEVLANFLDGVAIICTSPMGRMALNLLMNIRSFAYPIKLFPNKESALSWIESLKK